MRHIKKVLRLVSLIALMVLASVGIGIAGGVPVPPANRKEDKTAVNRELKEGPVEQIELNQQ